jgi:hypothetical protein
VFAARATVGPEYAVCVPCARACAGASALGVRVRLRSVRACLCIQFGCDVLCRMHPTSLSYTVT